MQQTEIFPPKSLAMELRKKGFNEPCVGLYFAYHADEIVSPKIRDKYVTNSSLNSVDSCTAPTYDQVVGWFASKGVDIVHSATLFLTEYTAHGFQWNTKTGFDTPYFESRQTALLTAFEEALKLI
jgi:hypothetical protein